MKKTDYQELIDLLKQEKEQILSSASRFESIGEDYLDVDLFKLPETDILRLESLRVAIKEYALASEQYAERLQASIDMLVELANEK